MKTTVPTTLTVAIALALAAPVLTEAATVTYTMQTGNNAATFFSGGGVFNNGGTEMGMYANSSGTKEAAAWRSFRTDGNNGGSARNLQVGDVFTVTVYGSAAFGNMGISLNAGGTQGGSYANRISGSRLYIQEDGTTGSWYVNNAGGNSTLDFNVSSTSRDYNFKVYITSQTTADVELNANGVTHYTPNLTLNGTAGANISAFAMYLKDDYNGAGNANIYWKQTTSVADQGAVNLGLGNSTGTISGLITDGLAADSTSTTRANSVIKIGTGTITLSNSGNSYTGGTTVNAGTLSISSDGNLGATTGGVTVNGGFNSVLAISSSLTLNAGRTVTIGSAGGKLDAGSSTLTIAGPLANTSGNNHLFILANGNTTVLGNATGAGDIVKQGTGTLTLNGSANTFGTTAANIYIDNGVVLGSSSTAFGQTSSGGGLINMGANAVGNNGPATLLLTSGGAAVTNAINARNYAGFNAAKTVGGSNTSGTVTFFGDITLNDSLNLTAVAGGTVAFNGVLQTGTATGGQSVNGTPGVIISGGGSVVLGGNSTYSGTTVVSNGTLQVLGSTAAGSSVSVLGGATLGGSGTVNGAITINSGGTLAPGNGGIGILTSASSPSLSGTVLVELNRSASTNADKFVRSGGALAYGGTLTVTNLGAAAQNGDTFDLFDASSFSGVFATLNLPPGGVLHWKTNNLVVDGTITFTNNPPVASARTYSVAQGGVITISLNNGAKSLVADADGDAVTVANIGATNAVDFGVAVISGGGASITYTNTGGTAGSIDLFSYTVSDGVGGLATNSISIRVDPAQGANLISAAAGGGFAYLTYAGIPGTNYALDWATNITYPVTWTQVQTKVAESDGSLRFTNLLSSYPTNDFFRTRYVP